MLPIYIAQLTFDRNKWYNNDNTVCSADKKDDYLKCDELLRRSLIFTCLYGNNHMVSGKDDRGNLIVNQLCFIISTIVTITGKTV